MGLTRTSVRPPLREAALICKLAHLIGAGEVDDALLDQLRAWTEALTAALGVL